MTKFATSFTEGIALSLSLIHISEPTRHLRILRCLVGSEMCIRDSG
ncbi:hypothetical protein ACX3V1_05200 [Escherichia coli]